jgi:hypothetical protein
MGSWPLEYQAQQWQQQQEQQHCMGVLLALPQHGVEGLRQLGWVCRHVLRTGFCSVVCYALHCRRGKSADLVRFGLVLV